MTTSGQNPNVKAAMIRNDIENTRAEMSRTVNQIEERLSPAHLKEQMVEQLQEVRETVKEELARDFEQVKVKVHDEIQDVKWAVREATLGKVEHMAHDVKETITGAGTNVMDTIKANPIPTALIAVGVGWLLLGRNTSAPRRRIFGRSDPFGGYHAGEDFEGVEAADLDTAIYGYAAGYDRPRRRPRQIASNLAHKVQEGASQIADETRDMARDVGEKVERVAHDARDTVGHYAEEAQMTAGRVARRARRGVVQVERGIESQLQENPLAAGAVAFALGAAVGLALPHTRREDEWLGVQKEKLLHRAEGVAHEAIQKAEEVAGGITEKIGSSGQPKELGRREDGGGPSKNV